jgi:hypothetical protein
MKRPDKVRRGDAIRTSQFEQRDEATRQLQGLRVVPPLRMNQSNGCTLLSIGALPSRDPAGFWAKITAYDFLLYPNALGKPIRYRYSWEEVEKTLPGYHIDAWTPVSGGRVGDYNEDTRGYNTVENMNYDDVNSQPANYFGNGVAQAQVTGNYRLAPAPVGVVLWMREVDVAGATEYVFTYENAIGGICNL